MPEYVQPAQQTQLGKEGRGLQPQWFSPDLGLITRTSAISRPKNSAQILKNLHWDGVSWTTQDTGWTKHRAGAFNSGAAFMEMGEHFLANGSAIYLQQVGTKVQRYNPLGDPGVETETDLFTAASATVPCFRSFSPTLLIYTNGVNNPQKYDGTTWAALTGFPLTVGSDVYAKPKLSETFAGRQVFAGMENYPFTLLLSEFANPEGWTLSGSSPARAGIINLPSRLGPITALKAFRLSSSANDEVLVVGTSKALVVIVGANADQFNRIILTSKFGIVNNRSFLQIDDTLYTLATDGIRPLPANQNLSGLVSAAASYPVHTLVTDMNASGAGSNAFVLDNPKKLEATWYFPQGADTHNRFGLIMNYGDGDIKWSTRELPRETVSASSWYSPACGIAFGTKYLCGGYNGILQNHYDGRLFDTVPIEWRYRSPLIEAPTPAQAAAKHSILVEFEGLPQHFLSKVFVYNQTATEQTKLNQTYQKNFEPVNDGGTVLGSWILGQGQLPGPLRRKYPVNPQGDGWAWELDIAGNTSVADANFVGFFATLIAGGTRQ